MIWTAKYFKGRMAPLVPDGIQVWHPNTTSYWAQYLIDGIQKWLSNAEEQE